MKGVLGGKARLPCRVDVANCGEVYFITWTKSESGTADADLWTRIYLYSDAVEKPLRDLVSRARFSLDPKEDTGGWLSLDKLRLSDETFYKCDVTYIQGKCPSLTLVRLEVLAAPNKAVIYAASEPVKRTIGPHSEGSVLDLRCEATGGKPAPKLSWWQIDKRAQARQLSDEFIIKGGQSTDAAGNVTSLELAKKLTREDLNTKFECRVEHEALSESEAEKLRARVELDLNGKQSHGRKHDFLDRFIYPLLEILSCVSSTL